MIADWLNVETSRGTAAYDPRQIVRDGQVEAQEAAGQIPVRRFQPSLLTAGLNAAVLNWQTDRRYPAPCLVRMSAPRGQ